MGQKEPATREKAIDFIIAVLREIFIDGKEKNIHYYGHNFYDLLRYNDDVRDGLYMSLVLIIEHAKYDKTHESWVYILIEYLKVWKTENKHPSGLINVKNHNLLWNMWYQIKRMPLEISNS